MNLWCCSHTGNEVVHHKKPPPLDVSQRFLCSYLDSLIIVKLNSKADPTKGKTMVSYDHLSKPTHEIMRPISHDRISDNLAKWMHQARDGWKWMLIDLTQLMDLLEPTWFRFQGCFFFLHTAFLVPGCSWGRVVCGYGGIVFSITELWFSYCVEMDSLVVVQLIQARDLDRSVYSSLVQKIKHLPSLCETCTTHVRRTQNNVSDCLAALLD